MFPNKITLLPEEDRQHLIPALDGPCYEFAIALRDNTGWPLIGLVIDGVIRHAGAERPDGLIQDARGSLDDASFIDSFIDRDQPYEIRIIDEKALRETRERNGSSIDQGLIRHFKFIIPSVWPELPIPPDHPLERIKAFAEELRALSERHGICIREQCPGAPIHFAFLEGDEQYALSPTIDGHGMILQRNIVS